MRQELKGEISRDVLALGSWVFYVLVIGRALIKPYRPFVDQLVIAGIFLLVVGIFYKDWEGYVARGLVLLIFTSLFYWDLGFMIFAIFAELGIVWSSRLSGRGWKEILLGLVIGGLASFISWFLPGNF